MIATQLLKGQGLGNQLFCYITLRCVAMDNGYDFAILGKETMADNIHSNCGMYFMDLDYGKEASRQDFNKEYNEKEDRIFVGNSKHDIEHGAYVTGTDENMLHPGDGSLLMGNMQDERYFISHKDEIKKWLRVKDEYDCRDFSDKNTCVLHLRCSDYLDNPELFLQKKYWINGMKHMKKINPDMRFIIITNDTKEASKILPGIPAYNFDLAKDYSIIKNARYLLLANSSFAFFPAFTSDSAEYILAPKYWARHNVSDGYWASEQNIYTGWHYMDRKGRVFSSDECRRELEDYKKTSPRYKALNQKPKGIPVTMMRAKAAFRLAYHRALRLFRGLKRKIRLKFNEQ